MLSKTRRCLCRQLDASVFQPAGKIVPTLGLGAKADTCFEGFTPLCSCTHLSLTASRASLACINKSSSGLLPTSTFPPSSRQRLHFLGCFCFSLSLVVDFVASLAWGSSCAHPGYSLTSVYPNPIHHAYRKAQAGEALHACHGVFSLRDNFGIHSDTSLRVELSF
jgi:hypothetical protein